MASSRSRTGRSTERDTSRVSSSEIVNATISATSTLTPMSSTEWRWLVDSPLTTTPVITLISGIAPSSFQRNGTPTCCAGKSPGRRSESSRTTGPSASSEAKKWSIAV